MSNRDSEGKFIEGNNASVGNNGGRPTMYKPEYCEKVIECMGKGLSVHAFAGEVGVSKDAVYAWRDKHSEFAEAIKIGRGKLHAFFEKMGLHAMAGKIPKFNASTYIFTMKNKCGWTDKMEQTITEHDINITIDGDDAEL